MSEAQEPKPKVRSAAAQMVRRGRKMGVTDDFYLTLAENQDLFAHVVKLVEQQKEYEKWENIGLLRKSVEKGVRLKDGVYRFWDCGLSLTIFRYLPVVLEKRLIFPSTNYERYTPRQVEYERHAWMKLNEPPQIRYVRFPLEGSANKTFKYQQAMVPKGEGILSMRRAASFLLAYRLSTGKRLLETEYIRTCDKGFSGEAACIGHFCEACGFMISSFSNIHLHPRVLIATELS